MQALYGWPRRHPRLLDSVLAIALVALGGGQLSRQTRPWPEYAALILAMVIPIVFRRKHPTGAFLAAITAGALQVVLLNRPVFADVSVLVLLYTLAAYRPRRISVAGVAICFIGAAVAIARWAPEKALASPSKDVAVLTYFAVGIALAWVLGDSMRYRRRYYRALEERAARLERERDAQAKIAAAAERARIARETHDVIAHNVSVMVVQADGAAFALDAEPEQARQALAAISRTGRQALTEMRRLLGVLRTDDGPAELAPQPGVGQLGDLLEQARAAGLPVRLTVEGAPRDLPGGADLAAYRVVQESLTNTRKHGGPGATTELTLRYGRDALRLFIADDGRGAAAPAEPGGHGLAGMRERVELYGGTVRSGPRPGGGFQVMAVLPFIPPAVTPGPAEAALAAEREGAAAHQETATHQGAAARQGAA